MRNFATLEMDGKPMDYFKTFRGKIKAVTQAPVQGVVPKYIQPLYLFGIDWVAYGSSAQFFGVPL
jgi:hypothetical protein